ncbi:PREDICTED: transmembrane and ubiquitin-like domain-containing protein 2 [Vollenhovia emeryi]|uniref:transmembrane and ubiquitin-like domain-containing protein 2 n=1 Tax=Vollenhovia emeryi TaxID=411798 RepID=UPI0005F4724E|nr:PREDICTED: transmembrane and ubiquitin-like domain-containing protein 2 [Vollenhovia emeryi]XP_011866274.1 PREDICTED: transmembrane and ubiquitin-like domain-containing protein 2 [Vollenhovia emeryi]
MSLIEGVGDEVTDFFIVMTVLLVGWLAWCSTSIADQPLIRTVLILRDRVPTRITSLRAQPTASSLNVRDADRPQGSETSEEEAPETISNSGDSVQSGLSNAAVVDTSESAQEISRPTDSATAEEVLIEAMDSFGNTDRSLLQRTAKANNSNVLDQTTSSSSGCVSEESTNIDDSNNNITIKLKFINDDQKVVTGSLKEILGDFKRRHFQVELEARKAVRLVFNGRVLQPDTQTLEQCGLFNDCVVHCWVHQPRPVAASSATLDNSSSIYFNSQSFTDLPHGAGITHSMHNEWDLSRMLVSILTIILGLAWYSRYHYAQLFTATTTIALYALTAIFTVSLFSNFFPDQDNIRNVE